MCRPLNSLETVYHFPTFMQSYSETQFHLCQGLDFACFHMERLEISQRTSYPRQPSCITRLIGFREKQEVVIGRSRRMSPPLVRSLGHALPALKPCFRPSCTIRATRQPFRNRVSVGQARGCPENWRTRATRAAGPLRKLPEGRRRRYMRTRCDTGRPSAHKHPSSRTLPKNGGGVGES